MEVIIAILIFIFILMLCSHESNTGDARRKRERDEYFKEADAAALRCAIEDGIREREEAKHKDLDRIINKQIS